MFLESHFGAFEHISEKTTLRLREVKWPLVAGLNYTMISDEKENAANGAAQPPPPCGALGEGVQYKITRYVKE